ncbi:hypothetical protein G7Y89_g534 [Cudoniella acicularis]|uniref:Major facilitator superfamily (MFS) profile domain-containing protein n=1 Tax=Cudoniella acicularis TaxID=354080 RepID=A0A8H4RYY7_9HELO|nr:hypothetical protein G7Y89_g534 [Cudoniella acicularis]
MNSSNTAIAESQQAGHLIDEEKERTPDSSIDINNNINNEVTVDEPELLDGYQLYMVVFAISLAGFLYSLDVTIIVTITYFIFIAIFEIGSLICGVAPSSTALVVGRAVAGIGGAGIFSGGLTIVGTSAPKEKRSQLVALIYVFSMLGSVVSPILGGVLTEKTSWRWCFYINLPAGAITLIVLTFVRIPESREKSEKKPTLYEAVNRLDPIGFALFAPTCIMVLLALQYGGSTYAWNSVTVIGLFVGAGATLIVFLCWENRRGGYGYVWFQTVLGVNPIRSGAYFMATAATLIASTLVTGVLAAKLGSPIIFSIIGNALAAIGGGLMSTFTPSTRTGIWVGYQILTGAGRGMTVQQPIVAVQNTLEPSRMAVGTSMILFCQFFGGALFLALAETDFSSSLRSALKQYAPEVDANLITDVGAAGVKKAVMSQQLQGVLKAYNQAITNTFYLGCAASGLAFLVAWGMGFARVKKDKPSGREEV